MGIPVNETALQQTEAAIDGMQAALSGAALESLGAGLGAGLQRLQAAADTVQAARKRAAAVAAAATDPSVGCAPGPAAAGEEWLRSDGPLWASLFRICQTSTLAQQACLLPPS